MARIRNVAGHGGEHDEEIERVGYQAVMEIPGAVDTRAGVQAPFVERHFLEEDVVQGHGAVNDATDRGKGGATVANEGFDLGAVADIAALNDYGCTLVVEVIDEVLDVFFGHTAAGGKNDVFCSLACKPAGHGAAEATCTACDEVRC